KGHKIKLHRATDFTQQVLPMTLGLLVDASGSMKEGPAGTSDKSKHVHAVNASYQIIRAMQAMKFEKFKSNGFVINFNSDNTGENLFFNDAIINPVATDEGASVKLLSEDPQALATWVNIPQTSRTSRIPIHGDTPMRDAVLRAIEEFDEVKKYDD